MLCKACVTAGVAGARGVHHGPLEFTLQSGQHAGMCTVTHTLTPRIHMATAGVAGARGMSSWGLGMRTAALVTSLRHSAYTSNPDGAAFGLNPDRQGGRHLPA